MSSERVPAEALAEGDLAPQLDNAVSVPQFVRTARALCNSVVEGSSRDRGECNPPHTRKALAPVRTPREIVAFKFGGTSLLGAARMVHAASLVRPVAQSSRVVVIVSAMKGVTDKLLAIAHLLAQHKNREARMEAESILRLH